MSDFWEKFCAEKDEQITRLTALLAQYQEALRVKEEYLTRIKDCCDEIQNDFNGDPHTLNPEIRCNVIRHIATQALAHQPPSDRKESV